MTTLNICEVLRNHGRIQYFAQKQAVQAWPLTQQVIHDYKIVAQNKKSNKKIHEI